MLSALRHKGVAKKVLWFVTIIIVLSFGFFGVANRLDHNINSAGTLFGKNISYRDFEKSYLDTRDQAIMLYGDRFFKLGSRLDLEQEAWDRMMLLHEARQQNITVSDEELVLAIAAVPFFQRDGHFDKNLYQTIVQNQTLFNRNVRDFEEGFRGQLMLKKLLERVAGPISISDEELKKEFQARNQKVKLSYVLFTPDHYTKSVTVTDDEVKEFYLSRKDTFRVPAQINLNYVQFTFAEKADEATKAKAKNQAFALFGELKPGADFKAIAKKYNSDVKTSGFFSMEQPILTFASSPEDLEKLFALKQGEFSKPLEVPDGWQIVQVNEKSDSKIPAFEEVKEKAKQALISQKAFELGKAEADKTLVALTDALKTKDFKTAATSLNLEIEETPEFSRGEYIANMGLVQEFQQEAMSLSMDHRLSTVVPTSQGAAILFLDHLTPGDEEQFKTEKTSFRDQLTAERRNQAMIGFMTKLRLSANLKSKIKHQK